MFLGQGQGQAQGQGLPGTEEVDRWTDTDRPSGLLIPSHTDIHSRSPPSLLLPLSHSLTTTTTTPSHTPSQSHLLPLSQIPPPPISPTPLSLPTRGRSTGPWRAPLALWRRARLAGRAPQPPQQHVQQQQPGLPSLAGT